MLAVRQGRQERATISADVSTRVTTSGVKESLTAKVQSDVTVQTGPAFGNEDDGAGEHGYAHRDLPDGV